MAHKHTRARPHAEFRHRSQIPLPAVEEVEQRLTDLLSPSILAPRQLERRDPRQPQRIIRMRQRLLTLPVMVASQTGSSGINWWTIAALATAAITPLLLIGIFLERYIVMGLTAGAGK